MNDNIDRTKSFVAAAAAELLNDASDRGLADGLGSPEGNTFFELVNGELIATVCHNETGERLGRYRVNFQIEDAPPFCEFCPGISAHKFGCRVNAQHRVVLPATMTR